MLYQDEGVWSTIQNPQNNQSTTQDVDYTTWLLEATPASKFSYRAALQEWTASAWVGTSHTKLHKFIQLLPRRSQALQFEGGEWIKRQHMGSSTYTIRVLHAGAKIPRGSSRCTSKECSTIKIEDRFRWSKELKVLLPSGIGTAESYLSKDGC